MNNPDKPLDKDRMNYFTNKYILEITRLITGNRHMEKEQSCGAVAALANILVIMVTRLAGKERAPDIVALALSSAFRDVGPMIEEVENEKHTNTKTSGS